MDTATPRFPLHNVPALERQLDALFAHERATALVASAACGADLVALTVAGRRGMRRRVILPFAADAFRRTSVTDRPGDWGPVFDRVLAELAPRGDVITLDCGEGNAAYVGANDAILEEAAYLGRNSGTGTMAVLIWEGARRGDDDLTAAFGDAAHQRGWRVEDVRTA